MVALRVSGRSGHRPDAPVEAQMSPYRPPWRIGFLPSHHWTLMSDTSVTPLCVRMRNPDQWSWGWDAGYSAGIHLGEMEDPCPVSALGLRNAVCVAARRRGVDGERLRGCARQKIYKIYRQHRRKLG